MISQLWNKSNKVVGPFFFQYCIVSSIVVKKKKKCPLPLVVTTEVGRLLWLAAFQVGSPVG